MRNLSLALVGEWQVRSNCFKIAFLESLKLTTTKNTNELQIRECKLINFIYYSKQS